MANLKISKKGTQFHLNNHQIRIFLAIGAMLLLLVFLIHRAEAGTDTYHFSLPNTDTGFERLLGVGVAFPHPYYQRPMYRFPVYDREGRGSLKYGYGGPEMYEYTRFNPVDGHHKK